MKMSKLCTPKTEMIMKQLIINIKKQRLEILKLEFYMYMEKQGYPNFWKTCKGILYPTKVWNKSNDHTLYWYFNFKDGNQVIIPLNKENSKFQELHKKWVK